MTVGERSERVKIYFCTRNCTVQFMQPGVKKTNLWTAQDAQQDLKVLLKCENILMLTVHLMTLLAFWRSHIFAVHQDVQRLFQHLIYIFVIRNVVVGQIQIQNLTNLIVRIVVYILLQRKYGSSILDIAKKI